MKELDFLVVTRNILSYVYILSCLFWCCTTTLASIWMLRILTLPLKSSNLAHYLHYVIDEAYSIIAPWFFITTSIFWSGGNEVFDIFYQFFVLKLFVFNCKGTENALIVNGFYKIFSWVSTIPFSDSYPLITTELDDEIHLTLFVLKPARTEKSVFYPDSGFCLLRAMGSPANVLRGEWSHAECLKGAKPLEGTPTPQNLGSEGT